MRKLLLGAFLALFMSTVQADDNDVATAIEMMESAPEVILLQCIEAIDAGELEEMGVSDPSTCMHLVYQGAAMVIINDAYEKGKQEGCS
jgi:hypothetical protein